MAFIYMHWADTKCLSCTVRDGGQRNNKTKFSPSVFIKIVTVAEYALTAADTWMYLQYSLVSLAPNSPLRELETTVD